MTVSECKLQDMVMLLVRRTMPARPLFVTMGDSLPPPRLERSFTMALTTAETLAPERGGP